MSEKGKAVGCIAELRDKVSKEVKLEEPPSDGHGPKGNPSSAGQNHKSKKDGDRRKRNKGRS